MWQTLRSSHQQTAGGGGANETGGGVAGVGASTAAQKGVPAPMLGVGHHQQQSASTLNVHRKTSDERRHMFNAASSQNVCAYW